METPTVLCTFCHSPFQSQDELQNHTIASCPAIEDDNQASTGVNTVEKSIAERLDNNAELNDTPPAVFISSKDAVNSLHDETPEDAVQFISSATAESPVLTSQSTQKSTVDDTCDYTVLSPSLDTDEIKEVIAELCVDTPTNDKR